MNVSSVLQTSSLREPAFSYTPGGRTGDKSSGKGSLFEAILIKSTTAPTEQANQQKGTLKTRETNDVDVTVDLVGFMRQLKDGDAKASIAAILQGISSSEELDWTQEDMQAVIRHLLQDNVGLDGRAQKELMTLVNGEETIDSAALYDIIAIFLQSDEAKMMEARQQIMMKVEGILQTIQTSNDVQKQSQDILELMKQWRTLPEKYGMSTSSNIHAMFSASKNSDEQLIWKELITAYQKRTQFAQNKHYQTNAQVTPKDVAKWLQQLIPDTQLTGDKMAGHHTSNYLSTSMTPVEQYVIHVEQAGQQESPSKQLLDQFQKIIQSSRFLTGQNGTNQLSLSLRPENLGDMQVKLTQINGEFTAKILVSSHAAKEMLEANLHQLKHMFSPHQVVIERTDVNLSSQATVNEKGDESFSGEEQGNSDESPDEQQDAKEEDFAAYMDELIRNGSVGEIDGRY